LPKFSMKLTRNGRFKQGDDIRRAFTETGAVQAAGAEAIKAMKGATPKVTGRLAGEWGTTGGGARMQGQTMMVEVVNTAPYARRVDRTSRRNRGYIGRGISAAQRGVMNTLKTKGAAVTSRLWNQTS
jgi:hypothetical protein